MKKLALVLLVVASLILCAMTMASCDMPSEIAGIQIPENKIDLPFDLPFLNKECEHQFVEEVTKAATCTEEGIKTLTCSLCGEVQEEAIPALGHDFGTKYVTDVPATCAAEGSKSYHCSRCDAKDSVKAIAALGHTWEETYTVDKEATCTENGQRSYHCEVCGAIDESRLDPIAAPGHNMDLIYTVDLEKTCSTAGWESMHCTKCDYTEGGKEIPASHEWGEWEVAVAETCTTDGYKARKCDVCGDYDEENKEVIAAHHTFGDDAVIDKLATVYADGHKAGTCAVCGEAIEEALKPATQILNPAVQNDNRDLITIGSLEGNNGHWTYRKSIASLTTDTLKYYPTAEDPDGNALITEVSLLINDTLDYNNAANPYFIFRIQNGVNNNKTDVVFVDEIHDDFDDACALAQTGVYTGTKIGAVKLPEGWHRFGLIVKQVILVEDADENPLTLVAGQLEDPTATIGKITYEWQCEMFLDGVSVVKSTITGFAAKNNGKGIYDSTNLLYTATVAEDGHTIIYADGDSDSNMHFRWENGFKKDCDEVTVLVDPYITCGKDFVQEVVPTAYNANGGKFGKAAIVDGVDKEFTDVSYYQLVGADPNPAPAVSKQGYILKEYDENYTAIWELDPSHTEHFTEGEKTVDYAPSIFAEGKQTYICDFCSTPVEEPIAKLEPSDVYSSKMSDGTVQDFYSEHLIKNATETGYNNNLETPVNYENRDLFFEFSILANDTAVDDKAAGLSDVCAQIQLNGHVFIMYDIETRNLYFKDVLGTDPADGIFEPDIVLSVGWHRVGLQLRCEAENQDGAVAYSMKLRLYVDGELAMPEDTWVVFKDSYASANKFFDAEIVEDELVCTANDAKIRFRFSQMYNSKSKTVLAAFDNFILSSKVRNDEATYAEMFEVDVTPLFAEYDATPWSARAVFDLDGGSFPMTTFHATQRSGDETLDYDYEVPAPACFQIAGTAPLAEVAPVKDGFVFAGWSEGVVDTGAKTTTYTALWTAIEE